MEQSNIENGTAHLGSLSHNCAFEEYRMYYESTERIIERRLALNRTNISLCLLAAASLGIILAWSYDKNDISHLAVIAASIISLLGALFCRWWARQIVSFKDLNAAKFKVLSAMAPKVVFPGASGAVKSFSPFDREWEELNKMGGLREYKLGYARKTSELIIPRSFMFIYLGTFVFSIVWIATGNTPFIRWLWQLIASSSRLG
jgi:hypothetical protein